MNLILYLFRHSWKLLLLAMVCSLVSGISGAVLVTIIAKAVAGNGSRGDLMWSFFATCLIYVMTMSISQITLMNMTQSGILDLRLKMSYKLLATPLKKLQALGRDGLLVIMTGDINSFVDSFPYIPQVLCNCIVLVSCLSYIGWLSWQLLLFIAVVMTGGMLMFYRAQSLALRKLVVVREHVESLYKYFRNLIDGSKELQLNGERGNLYIGEVITPTAKAFKETYIGAMTAFTWIVNLGTALFYVAIGMLLFVIPAVLNVKAEALATVTLVLLYLIRPVTELMNAIPSARHAAISLAKVQSLDGDLEPRLPKAPHGSPFAANGRMRLDLCGVRHQYVSAEDDATFAVGPLDVSVHEGEILYIVGGNGSGKTTLAMLLLGLYEAEAGTITFNGVPVNAGNIEDYRAHFSAVFADFHIFEEILGVDKADLAERAAHYVKSLDMAHKVKVTNGRFSTLKLSSGQRKRLALVSAYLEDRTIYLFDEWAADQDPRFKRIFYTELLPELKARGKTVIVITHDDAYFAHADRIIKLEDGHLVPMTEPEQPGQSGPTPALHIA
jgi:putative ATP-binding cassette transporter